MICGFINKDYATEYKDLNEEEVEQLCISGKYFSINNDSEYMIFIEKEIYTAKNIDKIMPLIMQFNKKLFLEGRK